MLVPATRLVLTVGLGLLFASPSLAPAFASEGRSGEAGTPVGHFSHVEGSVTRLHRFAPGVARVGLMLLAGDQVHVTMGRAEITLTDGSALQLDEHTRVALHAVDRFQVLDGRVFVQSSGAGPLIAESGNRRIHVAPGSAVEVTMTNTDLLVRVVDGDARIESRWGSDAVAATQSAFVSGTTGQPFVGPFVAPQHDTFHQWAGARMVVLVPPATFLPYAHPTYRQQEYRRVLRNERFERRRSGGVTRGERLAETGRRGGDRPAKSERRVSERRDDERSGEQARRNTRRERQSDDDTRLRSGASAGQATQGEPRRPPAKAPAAKARGVTRGLAVGPR
jgi:hypothetical protein